MGAIAPPTGMQSTTCLALLRPILAPKAKIASPLHWHCQSECVHFDSGLKKNQVQKSIPVL